jgi:hypothetical protein
MAIRRITVTFVDPSGQGRGSATGSVDRRVELIRSARSELEEWKAEARRAGDPAGNIDYTMSITDAPAGGGWAPKI